MLGSAPEERNQVSARSSVVEKGATFHRGENYAQVVILFLSLIQCCLNFIGSGICMVINNFQLFLLC